MNGLESAAKKTQTLEATGTTEDSSVTVTSDNAVGDETEEMDKGQYVGDGCWEEKTWKELVRLREDMFWARLGGFRG